MEMTTFEMLAAARDRMNATIKETKSKLDALGPRRKKAEAKVAALEKKRAEVCKANDDCDALEAALAELQQRRTKELGLAHIEGRKAAVGGIDKEIRAKTEQRAATVEQIEAARAATGIIETQLADARVFLASEVKAINEALYAGYCAMAQAQWAFEEAVKRYAATVNAAAQANAIVARHFEPISNMRHQWEVPSYYVWSDSREWGDELRERYQTEVGRLAVLGLRESRETVRSEGYGANLQYPTRAGVQRFGTYDARGNQIG